jgi:localization factor PodJL
LTHQVREARDDAVATAERLARTVAADLPQAGGDISAFRRDLETLHAHQAESDQRMQDTLEAVHETLERLVERLASVETGLAQPPAAAPAPERKLPGYPKPRRSARPWPRAPEAPIPPQPPRSFRRRRRRPRSPRRSCTCSAPNGRRSTPIFPPTRRSSRAPRMRAGARRPSASRRPKPHSDPRSEP